MLKSVIFNLLVNTHSGSDPDKTRLVDRGHNPTSTDQIERRYAENWIVQIFLKVVNGLFHVKLENLLSQQSGSDPDQTWSDVESCHPLWHNQVGRKSVKIWQRNEFLKFLPMLKIGNFVNFDIFLWPWPLTLTTQKLIVSILDEPEQNEIFLSWWIEKWRC